MEYELVMRLNAMDAKIDRIRQLLQDDVDEEQLNEIFGEMPEVEEKPQKEEQRFFEGVKDVTKEKRRAKIREERD